MKLKSSNQIKTVINKDVVLKEDPKAIEKLQELRNASILTEESLKQKKRRFIQNTENEWKKEQLQHANERIEYLQDREKQMLQEIDLLTHELMLMRHKVAKLCKK